MTYPKSSEKYASTPAYLRKSLSSKKVVVGVIILLLVVYTFYRLLHVWLHTLNFSEVTAHC